MALIEKQISNHPVLDLVRVLEVPSFLPNDDNKTLEFFYRIKHFKDGLPVDIKIPKKRWAVDNSYKAIIRDENFDPIPNPDYVPEYEVIGYTEQPEEWDEIEDGVFEPQPIYGVNIINEEEQYMRMPAYDYFKSLTFDNPNPISIPFLLEWYIQDNDNNGFYNFY
jgi:hypothetical protein